MNANKYQGLAARTRKDRGDIDLSPRDKNLLYASDAIAGEAGEWSDLVKKMVWHGHDYDPDQLVDELGDILWGIAEAATVMGVTLEWVMQRNIDKLSARYPDGYSDAASVARADVE